MAQKTVLVVEDDPLIRLMLVDLLEEEGYGAVQVGAANQAIAVLESRSDIHVVLTDVQMPGTMDGIALAHYVRKRWPPTIIIVSSGRVFPDAGELPDGATFMPKPYDPTTVKRVLSSVCDILGD